MADAVTLDSLVDTTDATPAEKPSRLGGLWNRVQKASQNLRSLSRQDIVNTVKQTGHNLVDRAAAVKNNFVNMTPEQKKTVGLSIISGIATKAAITFAVGTGGVAAVALIGTAMATGATVSLVQTAVTHAREGKSLKSFFNRENFKKVGVSAILAGGTAGWGDVLHSFLGQTVTHAATTAMNTKMNSGNLSSKLFAMVPGSAHAATLNVPQSMGSVAAPEGLLNQAVGNNAPQSLGTVTLDAPLPVDPAPAAAPSNVPQSLGSVPAPDNLSASPAPTDAPAATPPAPVEAPKAKVAAPAADSAAKVPPKAAANLAAPASTDTAPAKIAKPPVEAPKPNLAPTPTELTGAGQHPTLDNDIRKAALDRVHKLYPSGGASVADAAPAAPAAAPPKAALPTVDPAEVPEKVIARVKSVLSQEEVTKNFTEERLRDTFKRTTGLDAPANMTAADLAKQIHPSNPNAYLGAIQQQAPQLDTQHLAASCSADIPTKTSAVTKVKNICYQFKKFMSPNDFAVVDSGDQLRFVQQKAANLATGQGTTDFIKANISSKGGVLQEMAESKWAAEAAKLQPLATAP